MTVISLERFKALREQVAILKSEGRIASLGRCLSNCSADTEREAWERYETALRELRTMERVA
jgi:hypothetical protein